MTGRQDPVCEEPDFYNGPPRPTTCRGSPRGIPIWAHRNPVTPDRCSQHGETVRSDRRKPCKGRDVHRYRMTRCSYHAPGTARPQASRLQPGAGSQGSAALCICLSSFRISSCILPRKFYSCSPLLSGGITHLTGLLRPSQPPRHRPISHSLSGQVGRVHATAWVQFRSPARGYRLGVAPLMLRSAPLPARYEGSTVRLRLLQIRVPSPDRRVGSSPQMGRLPRPVPRQDPPRTPMHAAAWRVARKQVSVGCSAAH